MHKHFNSIFGMAALAMVMGCGQIAEEAGAGASADEQVSALEPIEVCPAICVCLGMSCPTPPAGTNCDPCNISGPPREPGPLIIEIPYVPPKKKSTPTTDPGGGGGGGPTQIYTCAEAYDNLKDCLNCCNQCTSDAVRCQDTCGYNPLDPMGPLLIPSKPGMPKPIKVPKQIWDILTMTMDPCAELYASE